MDRENPGGEGKSHLFAGRQLQGGRLPAQQPAAAHPGAARVPPLRSGPPHPHHHHLHPHPHRPPLSLGQPGRVSPSPAPAPVAAGGSSCPWPCAPPAPGHNPGAGTDGSGPAGRPLPAAGTAKAGRRSREEEEEEEEGSAGACCRGSSKPSLAGGSTPRLHGSSPKGCGAGARERSEISQLLPGPRDKSPSPGPPVGCPILVHGSPGNAGCLDLSPCQGCPCPLC